MATRKKIFPLPMTLMINIFNWSKDINFPLKGHLSRSPRLIYILQDDNDNTTCCQELCCGYARQTSHKDAASCHFNKATQISQKSGVLSGLFHQEALSGALALLGQTLEFQEIVHGITVRTGSLCISKSWYHFASKVKGPFSSSKSVIS